MWRNNLHSRRDDGQPTALVSLIKLAILLPDRELRRQRGQKKARTDQDVRKLGSYVLIKKVMPDGRYRDREDSLSDLASTFSNSFVPRRRSVFMKHSSGTPITPCLLPFNEGLALFVQAAESEAIGG